MRSRQETSEWGRLGAAWLTMQSYLTEESLWASGMASRLRLVQANFADDQSEVRQGYLAEEIERALKDVVPGKRKAYLTALAERFPAWQSSGPTRQVEAPPVVPETPGMLLDRLIGAASNLPPDQRQEFSRKLQEAGFAISLPGGSLPDIPPDLQKRLGLAPGRPVHPERVVKMLGGLLEMVMALDQLVWTLWRQMARQAKFQRELDFAKLAGPYLSGDPEVSTQLVAQPLERTRRLIAALLGAVGRAGSTFAKKHVARFGPEVIEDWARMEKKWNETLEYASWRKYREHYKEHGSEPTIESEIQDAIVKTTENLILGRVAG